MRDGQAPPNAECRARCSTASDLRQRAGRWMISGPVDRRPWVPRTRPAPRRARTDGIALAHFIEREFRACPGSRWIALVTEAVTSLKSATAARCSVTVL